VQLDQHAVGGALDFDARQRRIVGTLTATGAHRLLLQMLAMKATNLLVFQQVFFVMIFAIPAALPRLDDAQSQAIRMNLLSHKFSQSLTISMLTIDDESTFTANRIRNLAAHGRRSFFHHNGDVAHPLLDTSARPRLRGRYRFSVLPLSTMIVFTTRLSSSAPSLLTALAAALLTLWP
jgi:hypothetical protein